MPPPPSPLRPSPPQSLSPSSSPRPPSTLAVPSPIPTALPSPETTTGSTTLINSAHKYTFSIPLKPQNKPLPLSSHPHYPSFLKTEYATLYLQKLGATPTAANVNYILREAPIEECDVKAAWRKDGSAVDAVVIRAGGGRRGDGGMQQQSDLYPVGKAGQAVPSGDFADRDFAAPTKALPKALPAVITPPSLRPPPASRGASFRASFGASSVASFRASCAHPERHPSTLHTPKQRLIILKQLLLSLLRPFSTTLPEVEAAQDLFVRKFPFSEMRRELERGEGREGRGGGRGRKEGEREGERESGREAGGERKERKERKAA